MGVTPNGVKGIQYVIVCYQHLTPDGVLNP